MKSFLPSFFFFLTFKIKIKKKKMIGIVKELIIEKGTGVKLRAKEKFQDRMNILREAGEEW